MKIDIVTFDDSENVMGIYVDGKIHLFGDNYHDRMYEFTEGFVAGLKLANKDIEIKEHVYDSYCPNRFVAVLMSDSGQLFRSEVELVKFKISEVE